jgi:hypothetical protein
MIKEAPRADHPDLPVGQRARHFRGLAEIDPACRQQQLFRSAVHSSGTQVLLWPQIKITHVPAGLRIVPELSDS